MEGRGGEIGRMAAGSTHRVSYRVRGNARAFLMRIKSKRAVKPECKTAMATCNRYSARAVRSNRMRLRSHELPSSLPPQGADLCAICARAVAVAPRRAAPHVSASPSIIRKSVGRETDRQAGHEDLPPCWNFERVLRRPRHGGVLLSACSEGCAAGDDGVVCSRRDERTRGRRCPRAGKA